MKTYKGFNKDMTCRGFQYEEGKEYQTDNPVELCKSGFHACEDPIDCFEYYPPATSVYHEVEQSGELRKDDDDTKVASSVIKVGAKLDVFGIAKAHFEYVKSRTTSEYTDEKAATAGDYGAATAGYKGAATAGDSGAATAGDCGAATAGNCGAATAGYKGAATAGEYGAATSRGAACVGENGIACVRGNDCKVKGGLGAVLVIAEENEYNADIKEWIAVVVDGVSVKADTFYGLVDGNLVEVE